VRLGDQASQTERPHIFPPEPVESSMLTIYTRHAGDCDHRYDMNWRRCRCPKWIRGVLPNGRNLRTAAKTLSWEQAEKYARKLEAENDPLQAEEDRSPVRSTIRDAVQLFLDDQAARGLESSSRKKYRTVLQNQLLVWMEKHKIVMLDRIHACRSHAISRQLAQRREHDAPQTRDHYVLLRFLHTQWLSVKESYGSAEQAEDAGCSPHGLFPEICTALAPDKGEEGPAHGLWNRFAFAARPPGRTSRVHRRSRSAPTRTNGRGAEGKRSRSPNSLHAHSPPIASCTHEFSLFERSQHIGCFARHQEQCISCTQEHAADIC
jgi:hypothetical protein